jgi:hypothetical protein
MLTLDNISDKAVVKIGKLVGITFPDSSLSDRQEISRIIKNRGKTDDFMSIIDFMNASSRDDITDFMFKVKKVVNGYINSLQFYKDADVEKMKQETIDIRKTLKFNQIKAYCIDENDGKTYVSFDIQSANFTSLKLISGGKIIGTWETFLRGLVPNDVRSASKRNVEMNVAGLTVEIPNCLYESKFFRQFLLGDLKKLKFIWELENIKYLAKICEMGLGNAICVNSDELVIEVQNYDEADRIVGLLPQSSIHRIKKFRVTKIDGYSKNYMLKSFQDGSKQLMNVDPAYYDALYMKYIMNF